LAVLAWACTAALSCSSAHATGKKHFIALERGYHDSSSTGAGLLTAHS
jgi:hypothetical protein